jgi:hypothetical protein
MRINLVLSKGEKRKVRIGNSIIQFSKSILNDNYIPKNQDEKEFIDFIKRKKTLGKLEILQEQNIDIEKLKEGKRKKMLKNIEKLADFIDKKYYVNKKPVNFIEIAYKTGLSLSTIKRYLKNILKDNEIPDVLHQKKYLIDKIKKNLNIQ